MQITVDSYTDKGPQKSSNEDVVASDIKFAYTILADGMGGQQAGGVASGLVASTLSDRIIKAIGAESGLKEEEITSHLRAAVDEANLAVWTDADRNASHEGMGSTLAATLLHNKTLFVVHVGDSRAYLLRDKHLQQITKDHSFVQMQLDHGLITAEDMETSPQKNLLMRSMGAKKNVEPDITTLEVCDQDIVVCCSDGLLENGGHSKLEGWLREALEAPIDRAKNLCVRARENGSQDDISVQLIYFNDDSSRRISEKGRFRRMLDSFRSRLFQRAG